MLSIDTVIHKPSGKLWPLGSQLRTVKENNPLCKMTCNRQLTDLGNLTLKLKYSCSFSGIISQEHMHKGSLML